MELQHLPFPVQQTHVPMPTPGERQKITEAMAAGWKRYCEEEIYYATEHALALIRRGALQHQWATMLLAERKAALPEVVVADDLLEGGWPLHGIAGKLAKYRGQPARLAYSVLTADLTAERKAEIMSVIHALIDTDEAFLQRCRSIPGEVDALMCSKTPPKDVAALVSALDVPLDAAFWVDQYARIRTGKENPTWNDFKGTYTTEAMLP